MPSSDPKLSRDDLTKIASLLKECSSKWKEIGTNLSFLSEELNGISERPSLVSTCPDGCLRELLSQWLHRPTRYHPDLPTWEILHEVLKKADLGDLAEKVNKEMETLGISVL